MSIFKLQYNNGIYDGMLVFSHQVNDKHYIFNVRVLLLYLLHHYIYHHTRDWSDGVLCSAMEVIYFYNRSHRPDGHLMPENDRFYAITPNRLCLSGM